jgi:hypothetical protein
MTSLCGIKLRHYADFEMMFIRPSFPVIAMRLSIKNALIGIVSLLLVFLASLELGCDIAAPKCECEHN